MAMQMLPGVSHFLREMRRFQRDFSRLEDQLDRGLWSRAAVGTTGPLLNVSEDAESVCAEAELPGCKQDQIEVFVVGRNQLVIKGRREAQTMEKAVCHRQERGFTAFTRALTLPADVNPDQVEAKLENGVLRIRLAKSPEARPRKIAVKGE
ncbi:MAG TPA: Hsp20/alpha crystallin family protein [Gemmatales bacterium]|nr:Hsp20/alpha crystallin family protein [Gemmatales bacterium]